MTRKPLAAIGCALLLAAALAVPAAAQELKPWKHGVIEPKGDAGFQWMVGTRDFAARHGLKLEIVSLKNGAIAHKALLSGALDSVAYETDPVFNLDIPTTCPNVPAAALRPRTTWERGAAYDEQAARLARMFVENFRTFEQGVTADVLAAGPNA